MLALSIWPQDAVFRDRDRDLDVGDRAHALVTGVLRRNFYLESTLLKRFLRLIHFVHKILLKIGRILLVRFRKLGSRFSISFTFSLVCEQKPPVFVSKLEEVYSQNNLNKH